MKRIVLPLTIAVCVFLSAACGGSAQAQMPPPVAAEERSPKASAEGRLLPAKRAELAFNQGGRILEVAVLEGQVVGAGEVIARLEGAEQVLAVKAETELEILQAEIDLQRLEERTFMELGQAAQVLESARQAYRDAAQRWKNGRNRKTSPFDAALSEYIAAEEAFQDARKRLDGLAGMADSAAEKTQARRDLEREEERRAAAFTTLKGGYEAPKENNEDADRTRLVAAIAGLEEARLRVRKLDGGPDPDARALLEARLAAARAAREGAVEALRGLELRAPFAGTLVYLDARIGESAVPGLPLAAVADLAAWVVETSDLSENLAVGLEKGQAVTVTLDALPGEVYPAEVEALSGWGEKFQGDWVYRLSVRMLESDPRWMWNMTAKITVE